MGLKPKLQWLAFFTVYFLAAIYALRWLGRARFMQDFGIYAAATHASQSGGSAYLPYNIGTSFVYHPIVLSALSLLLRFGDKVVFVIWSIASAAAYFAMLWVVYRRCGKAITLLLAFFAPFLEQLFIGQINSFVALAIFTAWQFAERHRDEYAGAALAIAIALKLSPALLIIYFVARRRWRVLWGMAAMLAVITLIPVLQFGAQSLVEYVAVSVTTGGGLVTPSNANLGLQALIIRLNMPHPLAIYRLIFIGLVGVVTWLAWRRASAYTFALFILIMLELSPLTWLHHFVFIVVTLAIIPFRHTLLLPIYAALALVQAERLMSRTPIVGLFCFLAIVLLAWAYWKEYQRSPALDAASDNLRC